MQLCIEWLRRTTNSKESFSRRRSNHRRTWSYLKTRREPYCADKLKWTSMRMRWSVGTLSSNKRDKMRSRLWNKRLKQSVIKSSQSWPKRKSNVPPKRRSKSSSETTCMYRRVKRLPRQRREPRLKNEFVSVRNYRPLVNTSSDLKQNVQKRRNAWRKSSSVNS